MGALIVHDDVLDLIGGQLEKYESLVWFARKYPADHESWDKVPADIKQGALNAASRVEELYPDEVDRLRSEECGDWEHGFNSGVLAALRFVLHAAEDPEAAMDEFPMLDT